MARDNGIPANVQRLIYGCIDAVEQVEVLLYLRAEADASPRGKTAQEVSNALYIGETSAQNRLESLRVHNLVEVPEEATPRRYHYAPRTPGLSAAVDALAEAYKVRRVAVINLILEKPLDHLRSFSGAFDFRKKD